MTLPELRDRVLAELTKVHGAVLYDYDYDDNLARFELGPHSLDLYASYYYQGEVGEAVCLITVGRVIGMRVHREDFDGYPLKV